MILGISCDLSDQWENFYHLQIFMEEERKGNEEERELTGSFLPFRYTATPFICPAMSYTPRVPQSQ